MRLGEAMMERDHLNSRLDALESRLTNDIAEGRPLTHILEEIELVGNRGVSLQNAIDWTMQLLSVRNEPLGTYLNQSDNIERITALLEKADSFGFREKVDELDEAKKSIEIIIQTVYWAHDLMIPEIKVSKPEEED